VVTLGDSFTFGVGVADDDTYPVQLQRRLAAERPAEVLNLSFPGWNVHNALCAYRELGRRYSPDVVVFGFSMDDMAPTDPGVRYTSNPVMRAIGATGIGQAIIRHAIPRLPGHRREAPAASAELRAAWRAQPLVARRRPDLPRFAGLWESALRDLVALEREVRADGARLLVLVFPRYDQVRDERNGVARGEHFSFPQDYVTRRLQGLGIEFRDLLPALVAAAEEPFGTVEYGHPSEHGYALIGDVAAEALRGR
jgi:lysophospholipase L1-like esterase